MQHSIQKGNEYENKENVDEIEIYDLKKNE